MAVEQRNLSVHCRMWNLVVGAGALKAWVEEHWIALEVEIEVAWKIQKT